MLKLKTFLKDIKFKQVLVAEMSSLKKNTNGNLFNFFVQDSVITIPSKGNIQELQPPFCFQKKSRDFYAFWSVCLCSDCMLILTCNFNSDVKIYGFFFFQEPLYEANFEFSTIHHNSIQVKKS